MGLVGCEAPRSGAEVRAEFGEFSRGQLLELGDVRADIEILHDNDTPAAAWVQVDDEESGEPTVVLVESPVPMRCSGTSCELAFQLPPGRYRFTMLLYANDRCGREALLGAFRPEGEEGGIRLLPWTPRSLLFDTATFAFDDDGDGVENVLEVQVCGRTDWDDRDQGPRQCDRDDHPCCAAEGPAADRPWGSPLVGRMTRFGGAYLAYDRAPRTVEPFFLDATEVTWGQLARCVSAGACFSGRPDHPVRRALASADRRLPVVGVSPAEAQAYCLWAGKRLPLDEEWDFAAAARDDEAVRGTFPFDPNDLAQLLDTADQLADPAPLPSSDFEVELSCIEGRGRIAVNYAKEASAGEVCRLAPAPVASFPSSFVFRGEGSPVADLAGNVWEWTLPGGASREPPPAVPDDPNAVLPLGVDEIHLRGGNHHSAPLLLSNDFRLEYGADDAKRLLLGEGGEVADAVGFRCARSAEAGAPPVEPACGP